MILSRRNEIESLQLPVISYVPEINHAYPLRFNKPHYVVAGKFLRGFLQELNQFVGIHCNVDVLHNPPVCTGQKYIINPSTQMTLPETG